MGGWRAIASGSVREPDLRNLLDVAGTSWDRADHVTATTSLASAMRGRTGRVALPVAALLDLIVLPGHPDGHALSLDGLPGPAVLADDGKRYADLMELWQAAAGGRRLRIAFDMSRSLRAFVKRGDAGEHGALLLAGRRDLTRTVVALSGAGVEPGDLSPADTVARAAAAAWARMEDDVPAMTTQRRTLWLDRDELAQGRTAPARDVAERICGALDAAFGPARGGGTRTLVHHGFYFYTPAQWALFQSLRVVDGVDQIFVLHDDGANPAFKTWRLFFSEHDWAMPSVEHRTATGGATMAAAAYAGAMVGRPIDSAAIAADLELVRFRNPAEFVRDWRRAKGQPETRRPVHYAANAEEASRLVRRLDRDTEDGPVDLSELPVGLFLLAVHSCIDTRLGQPTRVRLTERALADMIDSGYLDVSAPDHVSLLSVLRRAQQFFKGCDDGHQWAERARALQRLVRDEVSSLGPRERGQTDAQRIAVAAANPLRLVPWADLSVDEADALARAVAAAVAVVEQTASKEELSLNDHLAGLRGRLEQGLQALPPDQAAEIMAKFHGFSDVGDVRIDVADLIDVVQMILGRHPALDPEETNPPRGLKLKELRALDALGFERSERPVHLANLADGLFPSRVSRIGWPFVPADLDGEQCGAEPIALEILEARSVHAGQSDLYLLWLALDGAARSGLDVPADKPCATLSWIEEMDGDLLNPSPLVALTARPADVPDDLADFVGGLAVQDARAARIGEPARTVAKPSPHVCNEDALDAAAAAFDRAAAAAALACRRRFVLQWALGDTAAFRAAHHHAILYGNVLGALQRLRLRSESQARRLCDDLWRHLTAGERSSSALRRVVKPGARDGARTAWLLTLAGSGKRDRPLDRAYKAADAGARRAGRELAAADDGFLPPGPPDDDRKAEICGACPVKDRCLEARLDVL
jgi:hypothetical protein